MRSRKAAKLRVGDGRDDPMTCLAPGERRRGNEAPRRGGDKQLQAFIDRALSDLD